MLFRDTLVRIVGERNSHWNDMGEMDRYKNAICIIKSVTNSLRFESWYQLSTLPGIEDEATGYGLDFWKWRKKDFKEFEYHCSCCGERIDRVTEDMKIRNNLICKKCADAGRGLETHTIDYYKNFINTSILLNETEKENLISNIEKLEVCVHCGELIIDNLSGRDQNDKPVCHNCRNYYYYCEHCSKLILKGEHFTGPSGMIYCSAECLEAADPYDFTRLLAYNAKPPVKFLGSENENSLYMGVEVEIDGGSDKDDCIYNIFKTSKDVYCKHDGSLGYGFEFVTQPATLSYHKNNLKYDDIINVCKSFDFKSDSMDTTGLHVHVSRKFFSTPESAKEGALKLEILMERFWNTMLLFARRDEIKAERWAKRRYFLESDYYNMLDNRAIRNFINEMNYDRYTAINTTNSNTIEFRLFSGSIKKEIIFATLEFVDLLCRYVKGASFEEVKNVTWIELLEPINKKKYKELKEYMNAIGLLPSPMVA